MINDEVWHEKGQACRLPVPSIFFPSLMLNDLHIHLSRLQDDLIYTFFSMRLANRELITVN